MIVNSIGDFAESLILGTVEDIKEGKSLPPKLEEAKAASAGAPAKDVSKIQVPDEMMRQILGESYHPQDTPPVEGLPELVWEQPEEEAPAAEPAYLTEETGQQLVSLLEEVKSLVGDLREMTSAGAIGVNLAGPVADPMSPHKSRRNKKDILKDSIRRRLK